MKAKLFLVLFVVVLGTALFAGNQTASAASVNHAAIVTHTSQFTTVKIGKYTGTEGQQVVSPDINRVTCSGNGFLKLYTDYAKDIICFEYAGDTGTVAIYNTWDIYTGNNLAGVYWTDNVYDYYTYFGTKYTDNYASDWSGYTYAPRIYDIVIY